MKTRFTLYALLFALLLFSIPDSRFTTAAHAVGTASQTLEINGRDSSFVWTVTFTADASDGSIPSATMSAANLAKVDGYYLYQVVTNPGSTAPTDNWDVVILNSDGVADVLGSQCLNRDTANSETCFPINYYLVDAALTMSISGNSVNSATGTVKVFFVK
jgi:hypothetical protein